MNTYYYNFRAKRELKDVQSFLTTFKKPSITLPETFLDIPDKYKTPYIVVSNGNVDIKKIETLQVYDPTHERGIVYVTLSSDNNQAVDFVFVVFKGKYYIVLHVGINRPDSALVIVSITNFVRDKELIQKESENGVINTLTLYDTQVVDDWYYKDDIIKMLLKKYPSIGDLNPNYPFFTDDDNTMSRSHAFNFKSEFNNKHFKFSDVVKLCIHNRDLYLCIGLKDTGFYNPSYDLYLYSLNGEKHTESFSFQVTGFQDEQFSALRFGSGSPVSKVNRMKFYSLNNALLSFKPNVSTSTVGSRDTSTSMLFSTDPRPDYPSDYVDTTSSDNNMSSNSVANGSGGSSRRKSKRKYKRTRTSKINKKSRKTHTQRIRR